MNNVINKLLLGDNLQILKTLESKSVDLIYLDPPFFSNRNYEVIQEDNGEIRGFQDQWSGGIDHYVAWLKERVMEMHRVLKSTGSIFLHCDWHANAYIRVFILDKIFGEHNFRNEIIWCYKGPSQSKRNFPQKHDTIWRYSKTSTFTFHPIKVPYLSGIHNKGTLYNRERASIEHAKALRNREQEGKTLEDWWSDIGSGAHISVKERIGYPTQKPEALLERIIRCASNEGDMVLDPFVGSGTTVVVAERLQRYWIGIDQSEQAVKVSRMRLQQQHEGLLRDFSNFTEKSLR